MEAFDSWVSLKREEIEFAERVAARSADEVVRARWRAFADEKRRALANDIAAITKAARAAPIAPADRASTGP